MHFKVIYFFHNVSCVCYMYYFSGELNQIGDKILVARGGVGGSPNNQYNGQKGQVGLRERNVSIYYLYIRLY